MRFKTLLFNTLLILGTPCMSVAQEVMTPDLLWSLGRVNLVDVSSDGQTLVYSVARANVAENRFEREYRWVQTAKGVDSRLDFGGLKVSEIQILEKSQRLVFVANGQLHSARYDGTDLLQHTEVEGGIEQFKISEGPEGQWVVLFSRETKTVKNARDRYPNLEKAQVTITEDLMYRHWDSWSDDRHRHLCLMRFDAGAVVKKPHSDFVDLMEGEPYDCPGMPFGGTEDFDLSPDGRYAVYSCKKLEGKEAALSTNTDLYWVDLNTLTTTNITPNRKGYDRMPRFSPNGAYVAYLSMSTPGYESDLNELWLRRTDDGSEVLAVGGEFLDGFDWRGSGEVVYGLPDNGTHKVRTQRFSWKKAAFKKEKTLELASGDYDFTGVRCGGTSVFCQRSDMNHAPEVYRIDGKTHQPLSRVNDAVYARLQLPKVERHTVKTADGKDMMSWVIYPPNFDPKLPHPALLYCQGGPQSMVSAFYSFRWNFQLMASMGYVVIAPNRRGVPGFGEEWNRAISGDWGGKPMADYLSATDYLRELPGVDPDRIGAVGASYGGYSVYMLAGLHQGRFNALIAHCGLFDMQSWYGTTEELFFAEFDLGGSYWGGTAPISYTEHNPMNLVDQWETPLMVIHGGKDFRVPENQGFEAFQAAQLRGIPSRLVYFPEEGHWILQPQNALVWQSEFFGWLDRWLKR